MGYVDVTPFSVLVGLGKRTKKDERIQSICGCVISSYWRRGHVTDSSVYSESDLGFRYAVPGSSYVCFACCCCLFAQVAQLRACVCVSVSVAIGTLLAHVVFDSLQREAWELVHCMSSF